MLSGSENENKDSLKNLKRKKIREQMEFYFSDSNLAKDRFLKQQIQNSTDGFIDLNLFLRFNKLRSLTDDVKKIAKSIKHSEILELNEDKSKVHRKIAFTEPSQKDTDKRTIYVENLPNSITNEKLKRIFKNFGEISYISLPKFKSSFQLKGFAFIEFVDKTGAKNAVKNFENFECSKSIEGKFPKSNPKIVQLEKQINRIKETIKSHEKEQPQPAVKSDLEENCIPKRRLSESLQEDTKIKRKKDLNDEELLKELSLISKKNWLKLREDFFNRQKNEIEQLKLELARLDQVLKQKISEKYKTTIKTDDIIRKCIIRLSLVSNDDKDFEIFKLSRQQFKNKYIPEDLFDHIAYVDIQKNSNRIYIRCRSYESALFLLSVENFLKQFKKNLLEGAEETEYFEKIYSNRNKKQEKKEKKIVQTTNEINKNETLKNIVKAEQNDKNLTTISAHLTFDDDL